LRSDILPARMSFMVTQNSLRHLWFWLSCWGRRWWLHERQGRGHPLPSRVRPFPGWSIWQ
jgi:hypothetical protein